MNVIQVNKRKYGLVLFLLCWSLFIGIETDAQPSKHQIVLMVNSSEERAQGIEMGITQELEKQFPLADIRYVDSVNFVDSKSQWSSFFSEPLEGEVSNRIPIDQKFSEYAEAENIGRLDVFWLKTEKHIYNGSSDPLMCARSLWLQYFISGGTYEKGMTQVVPYRFETTGPPNRQIGETAFSSTRQLLDWFKTLE